MKGAIAFRYFFLTLKQNSAPTETILQKHLVVAMAHVAWAGT